MHYREAMGFVEGFSRAGKPVCDLSRIRGLMQKLDDPQDTLRFVHIAGTNGKGSVAEYLTNIFMEAGYKTGTFTSPYIRRYRDRIRLNRKDISEQALCQACERVRAQVRGDEGYSQFEITFAMAMLYFQEQAADIVVLETGVGGLLDCTNVIRNPDACVLTTIALDHMAVLGDTIAEITAQKAGIIKPGAQVILSPKNLPATVDAVREKTQEMGNTFWMPDLCEEHFEQLSCTLTGTQFRYFGQTYETIMGGEHQIANALTAIETAYALGEKGWRIPGLCVERGIAGTAIPGRMQLVSKYPPTLIDGGHNRDGIEALCKALRTYKNAPIIGIIGMTHADAAEFAAGQLAAVLDRVLCVDGFTPGAMPAAELDALFDKTLGSERSQSVPLSDSLRIAKNWARANHGMVVVCGSLFLASWYLHEEG